MSERDESKIRAETATTAKASTKPLGDIVARAFRQFGHGLTDAEVLALADEVNRHLPL
jgi:hypothetical protein